MRICRAGQHDYWDNDVIRGKALKISNKLKNAIIVISGTKFVISEIPRGKYYYKEFLKKKFKW